ncbi:MAG TPA: hypothetical protein PLB59_06985 [Bacteroidales bacterium]|jgi:hypothetical protein|nr:hypothetical protein [Bacteroidales bacterium]HNZ42661.1 hypothetical protein [Bacteroidales bacterium]HPB25367.1 hypothetical protein [Bacteroidales bacterium]HPI30128.1 hypothetical protein [Bacteroidales bacterium]HQN16140.1 hypothetical protein [Bacteroidales bacterium]
MTKKILLYSFLFIVSFSLFSQKENAPFGSRSGAMGHASVTFTDFWSVQNNQAGMAYYDKIAAGIYYENRFITKELGLKCFSLVVPVNKAGVFGVNVSSLGYRLYNESKIGLAYGMSFGKNISAGVQLDYIYTHIGENYGNKGAVTFEAGIRAVLIKNLVIGAHIFNPIQVKLASYNDERLPLIFKIGLSYTFSDKAVLAVEVEKDNNFKPVFKTGLEYHVAKPVFVRIGVATTPFVYSFGAGFEFYHFKLDISASRHPVLGFTPQASLVYDIHPIISKKNISK